MNNFIHPGEVNTYTAPYAVASGGGFQVGSDFAVAAGAAAQGAAVEGRVVGVFDLPKSTAGGSGGAQGLKVYWDNAAKLVTKTAAANLLIGTLRRDAADADLTFRVRVTGQVS
jgi:predicted RecA/RadA family phage recombinase